MTVFVGDARTLQNEDLTLGKAHISRLKLTLNKSCFSAIKCSNCIDGFLLPRDSLDYNSTWICVGDCSANTINGCGHEMPSESVEKLVDEIEEQLEHINTCGDFDRYSEFIKFYSSTYLHKNHYLNVTAARNLIQWYTYRSDRMNEQELREKLELCKQLDAVLGKIDPGYSEIRSFVQKELHFTKMMVNQSDLEAGFVDRETYLEEARISMKTLEELDRYKRNIKFNCLWEE